MSMLSPAPVLEPTGTDDEDDLCHTVCHCNEDLALCGVDVSKSAWGLAEDDELDCVVCEDLAVLPCPRCGCLK